MDDEPVTIYSAVSNIKPLDGGNQLAVGAGGTLHIIDRSGVFEGTYQGETLYTPAYLTRCHEVYADDLSPYPYSISGHDTLCELCGHESEFEDIQELQVSKKMAQLDNLLDPETSGQAVIVRAIHDVKLQRIYKALGLSTDLADPYVTIAGVRVRLVIV